MKASFVNAHDDPPPDPEDPSWEVKPPNQPPPAPAISNFPAFWTDLLFRAVVYRAASP